MTAPLTDAGIEAVRAPTYSSVGKQVLRDGTDHVADAVDTETAVAIVEAMNGGWRDITDAPRDGSRLLVHYITKAGSRIEIGYWDDERYCNNPKPHWTSDLAKIWGKVLARKSPPKHWMPLPAAPQPPSSNTGETL